jgi:hypothetical protein
MPRKVITKRHLPHGGSLCLEPLEDRQLLSGAKLIATPPRIETSIIRSPVNSGLAADRSNQQGVVPGQASVLLGNGDGTFQPARDYVTPIGGSPIVVADFNHDGIPDLAVVNRATGTVSILLGTGDGTFKYLITFATGGFASSLTVGDFDRNGIPDLAVSDSPGESQTSRMRYHAHSTSDQSLIQSPEVKTAMPIPPVVLADLDRTAERNMIVEVGDITESHTPVARRGLGGTATPIAGQPPALSDSEDIAEIVQDLNDVPMHGRPAGKANDSSVRNPGAVSPAGQLVAGLLPIDPAALQRAVDKFFSLIEDDLGDDGTGAGAVARLTPWLAAGAVISAAYAMASRRAKIQVASAGRTRDDRKYQVCTLFLEDAMLSPWKH